LRLGETLGLTVDDIDRTRMTVHGVMVISGVQPD